MRTQQKREDKNLLHLPVVILWLTESACCGCFFNVLVDCQILSAVRFWSSWSGCLCSLQHKQIKTLMEVFEHLELMNPLVWTELQTGSISGLLCQKAELGLSLPCCGVIPSASTNWQLSPTGAQCSFGENALILCAGCSWHCCSIRVRTCDSTCLWELCRTIESEIASVHWTITLCS